MSWLGWIIFGMLATFLCIHLIPVVLFIAILACTENILLAFVGAAVSAFAVWLCFDRSPKESR